MSDYNRHEGEPLLLRPAEAARLLGLTVSGLRDRTRRGAPPLPIYLPDGNRPRYVRADIEAWIESLRSSTAA